MRFFLSFWVMVDKVALGQIFLRVLRFSLSISYHNGSHTHISPVGWAVDPLMAAVQRHRLTRSTWNARTEWTRLHTCVSVSFRLFESCSRLATDRYLFFSNSASSDLICAAVNAVRGLFLRSSGPQLDEEELLLSTLHLSGSLDVLHTRLAFLEHPVTP
jgi:hypothetical protein